MKNAIQLFAAIIATILFASCSHQPIYLDANPVRSTPTPHYERITEYQSSNVSAPSYVNTPSYTKSGLAPAPVVKTKKHTCTKCGSWFCPKPDCCDTVSNRVLSRATGQGGTGEPQIGLIPTMKTLAPEL